jgi:hypothetical protein
MGLQLRRVIVALNMEGMTSALSCSGRSHHTTTSATAAASSIVPVLQHRRPYAFEHESIYRLVNTTCHFGEFPRVHDATAHGTRLSGTWLAWRTSARVQLNRNRSFGTSAVTYLHEDAGKGRSFVDPFRKHRPHACRVVCSKHQQNKYWLRTECFH